MEALYFSASHYLLAPKWSGVGVIFTLHYIRPFTTPEGFWPNRILDITPEFLETAICAVKQSGYKIVSLDEVSQRLNEQRFDRKFAAFTLDDGYLDNFVYALPIFEKHEIPFAVYVASGLPECQMIMWWEILERLIRENPRIDINCADQSFNLSTESVRQKYQAFNVIYWALRKLPEAQQSAAIQEIIDHYEFDWQGLCRSSSMTWDMIRQLSRHPLATIGAHTVHHHSLSKLKPEQVKEEAHEGKVKIEQETGILPTHFAYPYGDAGSAGPREFEIMRESGFTTATTTRKGVLFPEHGKHLHALPRVSLNGDYQKERYVKLFLRGTPFALSNRFKRLNVA